MKTRSLLAALAILLLPSIDAEAAKRRAVGSPSLGCSFGLATSPSLNDSVPAAGVSRMPIGVTGLTSACSTFAAYSTVSWISVAVEGPQVYVDVAPNTSREQRSGVVMIAGLGHTVLQSGQTNMLTNGSFDSNIAPWSWNHFPNSSGSAAWSALDARGTAGSGSIRLRDFTWGDPAFQRMQCVNAVPGLYEYGFTSRSDLPQVTQPVIAFINFTGPDCTGSYPSYSPKTFRVEDAGVWETHSYVGNLQAGHQSIMIVIAAYARQQGDTQEVWVDDVYLRAAE